MKKLFIAIAALAAMTSCSQDEVMEVAEKQAISFGNAFIENATRAIDPSKTEATLTSFNVWGTVQGNTTTLASIFAGTEVTGTVGNGKVWNTVGVTQYWIPGAIYNFAALVNATVTEDDLGTDKLPKTVTFTNTDGATDLLYAKIAQPITAAESNNPVNMNFNHMLSKAVVTVSNTTNPDEGSTGYYYKVENVEITTAHTKGTCTLSTTAPVWSGHNGTKTLSFGNITGETTGETAIELVDNTEKAASYKELLLIPSASNTNDPVTIQFDLSLYKDNGDNADELINYTADKEVSASVNFKAGYAYSFNISLSIGQPIQFSVTSVPSWLPDGGPQDVTVE